MDTKNLDLTIQLSTNPRQSSIKLNGEDISSHIQAISIEADAHVLPKVTLTIIPARLTVLLPRLKELVLMGPSGVEVTKLKLTDEPDTSDPTKP